MSLILLIETATTSCSVALADNETIIASKELHERNIHASHITLFIQEVLEIAAKTIKDINAVAVSRGPGSYTGLRIGVSTAKGLCYALDLPLIAIDTLKSMASGLILSEAYPVDGSYYCPMIDARRMEVYTAVYDHQLNEILPVQAKIIDPDSFTDVLAANKVIFFGDGAFKCSDVLTSPNALVHKEFINSSVHMAKLAYKKFLESEFEDVAYFEPFYLKDFLILKPGS